VLWLAFDRTGQLAVANADSSAWLWDARPLDPVLRARLVGHHDQPVFGVTVTPDGSRVVTVGGDGVGVLWHVDETAAIAAAARDGGGPLTERECLRHRLEASPSTTPVEPVRDRTRTAVRRLRRRGGKA